MFTRDGTAVCLPEIADLDRGRSDDIRHRAIGTKRSKSLIERPAEPSRVEGERPADNPLAEGIGYGRGAFGPIGRRGGVVIRARQQAGATLRRDLSDRTSLIDKRAHASQHGEVVVSVHALAAIAAFRGDQAESFLPGAQERGRETRQPGQRADLVGSVHATSLARTAAGSSR